MQNILQVARDIEQQFSEQVSGLKKLNLTLTRTHSRWTIPWQEAVMRALLAGFPDRLAKRRAAGKNTALMVGGRAVQLAKTSGVQDEEFFLCIDIDGGGVDATVRQASAIDIEWLDPNLIETKDSLFFHPTQQQVVARRIRAWDDLPLSVTPISIEDHEAAAEVLYQEA